MTISGDGFNCPIWEERCNSHLRARMLLNIQQYTEQPSQPRPSQFYFITSFFSFSPKDTTFWKLMYIIFWKVFMLLLPLCIMRHTSVHLYYTQIISHFKNGKVFNLTLKSIYHDNLIYHSYIVLYNELGSFTGKFTLSYSYIILLALLFPEL